MATATLLAALFCVSVLAATPVEDPRVQFNSFRAQYKKSYTGFELEHRFNVFKTNLALIDDLNAKYYADGSITVDVSLMNLTVTAGVTFGVNQFADLTSAEFKERVLMFGGAGLASPDEIRERRTSDPEGLDPLPTSFDWRALGAVTNVSDQGQAGTCWSFSTAEVLEGANFLSGKPLVALSKEQIVDCDPLDCGVKGGWPHSALEYISHAGGLLSEAAYPYCAGYGACGPCLAKGFNKSFCGGKFWCNQTCKALHPATNASNGGVLVQVANWTAISDNETVMQMQMQKLGPLSVCLNAGALQLYRSGVFDPPFCDPDSLDHAVLLVGWGIDTDIFKKPYWIVKNSWGATWGEQGYFRIKRGDGKCGINTAVVSPVLQN